MSDLITTILDEVRAVVPRVDSGQLTVVADRLAAAGRIFVTGEGRSGFMARAFAMRLMHLGLTVHVIGETTTPSVGAGDTVVAVSGSGTTAASVRVAEQSRQVGAELLTVTTEPDSPLGLLAAQLLVIPAATKYRRDGEAPTIQPLSSLFDQVTHLALDAICLDLAQRRDIDNATAKAAHANTE